MLHGGEIYGKTIEHDFSVNLNPLPCPESVMKALEEAARRVSEYPDIHQRAFREAVAASEPGNITAANVIGGNGASELLAAVVRYVDPRTVLLPVPSFSGYRHALGMLDGCDVRTYMLSEENDFGLDSSILAQIDEGTGLLILANPNNPTGRCIDDALLAKIVTRCRETKTGHLYRDSHQTGHHQAAEGTEQEQRFFFGNLLCKEDGEKGDRGDPEVPAGVEPVGLRGESGDRLRESAGGRIVRRGDRKSDRRRTR